MKWGWHVACLFPLINYKSWSNRMFKQRQVHVQGEGCNFQFCSHAPSKIWVAVTVQFVLNSFLPLTCKSLSGSSLYSGSSSWMMSSGVFWLVHRVKQRVGTAALPQGRRLFLGSWSVGVNMSGSSRVAGLGCWAAGSRVSLQLGDSLPLGGSAGSSRCGTPAGPWGGAPAPVAPPKCCNHNKPVMVDGFLHRALITVLN